MAVFMSAHKQIVRLSKLSKDDKDTQHLPPTTTDWAVPKRSRFSKRPRDIFVGVPRQLRQKPIGS
jgi:hypothetical protein